jgi:alanine racemase
MHESNWLEIDLTRLDANLAAFRSLAGTSTLLCAVVKADAYGTGAVPVAQRLAAQGVDMLAVYNPEQARELVANDIEVPILIMGPLVDLDRDDPLAPAPGSAPGCASGSGPGRVQFAIHSGDELIRAERLGAKLGWRLAVHLHMDTGMSRGGIAADELGAVLEAVRTMKHVRLAGLWTHMASSDDDPALTELQCQRFDSALAANDGLMPNDLVIHIANTFTTLRGQRYHRAMVRIGLGLYGFGPQLLTHTSSSGVVEAATKLAPIVRWCSRIAHVRRYPKGAGVGYNQTCHLARDSVLGVVPVGYADGYHLSLSNRGIVGLPELHGEDQMAAAPIVGKVNMDQIVIDLTDLPTAKVGSLVELYSNDSNSPAAVPALAQLADSHPYDMLTCLSTRIPRHYHE